MSEHKITRKLEFDAGHRIHGHESKCANIHGHRYVVELTVSAQLDQIGRVIDFSVLKSVCGKWIDDNLDHGMILYRDDPLVSFWELGFYNDKGIDNQKYFLMDDNPTAENIAKLLYEKFQEMLCSYHIDVVNVLIRETPNCWAMYDGLKSDTFECQPDGI